MKKINLIMIAILLLLTLLVFGCEEKTPTLEEMKFCQTVDDCACGTLKTDGSCFAGNKKYVNTQEQCPDFCSGIAGNLKLTCSKNNQCEQESILPADKDEITEPEQGELPVEPIVETDLEQNCISSNGKWLEEYKECEGIPQTQCESLGGTFNECGSACRHNPEAEACILMCVPYCAFN